MQPTPWVDMLRLVPEAERTKLVIVLVNGTELCVDTIIRYEESFVVMRGRVGGQVEEARGFFVPYDQMLCLRLDRIVKVEEMQEFFGPSESTLTPAARETPLVPPSNQPTPTVPTDPAVASRLLLERIRAVRASSANRYTS